MKIKSTLLTLATMFVGVMSSNAATMIISNVTDGPGDTLYATSTNSLMNGGIVTMGYFAAGITQSQINTISGLVANLGSFTIVTSLAPGSPSSSLSASVPGYAQQDTPTSIGNITGVNPLLGRTVYSIVTSAASLALATGSSEFALLNLGNITDDVPVEGSFSADPKGRVPVIGTIGTFTGDPGSGAGTYGTLKMAVVPEPSAALLGAIGALGLLRRRRN